MSIQQNSFIKSFINAFRGIIYLFKNERNARIELIIAFLVIIAGFFFRIDKTEWLIILLCIMSVLSLEGINTAFESFANKIHPTFDKKIGNVKDLAAGAVLIAAVVASIVGFVIFAPKFINLFTN